MRADTRHTFLVIMRALAWRADRATLEARPTLAYLVNATGRCTAARGGRTCTCGLTRAGRSAVCTRSLRTIQRRTRLAEEHGLLDLIEEGTTPQFRPLCGHHGRPGLRRNDPNLARTWRLNPSRRPATVDPAVTPPGLIFKALKSPIPGARETQSQDPMDRLSPDSLAHRPSPGTSKRDRPTMDIPKSTRANASQPSTGQHPWLLNQTPQRRAARLAACDSLRAVSPVLRRMSACELRSALREWFAADRPYSPWDVLYALDRQEDGTPHTHEHDVRVPAAWLAWRLSHWRGPDGRPVPPRSAQLADRAERDRRALAAERERLPLASAPRAPEPTAAAGAALARELLDLRARERTAAPAAARAGRQHRSWPGPGVLAPMKHSPTPPR